MKEPSQLTDVHSAPNPVLPAYLQVKKMIDQLNNKKNYKNIRQEILQLVSQLGPECEKFMFICLLNSIDVSQKEDKKSIKVQFLQTQIIEVINKPQYTPFIDYFSQIVWEANNNLMSLTNYMNNLFLILNLNTYHQIAITLSLCLSSIPDVKKEGISLMKQKLTELKNDSQKYQFNYHILHMLIGLIKGTQDQEFQNYQSEINHIIESNQSQNTKFELQPILKKTKITQNEDKIEVSNLVQPHLLLQDLGPRVSFKWQQLDITMKDYINQLHEKNVLLCLVMMANKLTVKEDQVQKSLQNVIYVQQSNTQESWNKLLCLDDHDKNADQSISWDYQNFIKWINDQKKINWSQVMQYLDSEDVELESLEAYQNLFEMFQFAKETYQDFNYPSQLFFQKWANPIKQIQFLQNIVSSFNNNIFATLIEKYIPQNDLKKNSINFENFNLTKQNTMINFWKYQPFFDILIELSESDYFNDIRKMFEPAMLQCPEVLLLGIFQSKNINKGAALIDELISTTLPPQLINQQNQFLDLLWSYKPEIIISAVCELYKKEKKKENSQFNLSKVLDISQSIKDSLLKFVNYTDYQFAVPLAVLAGKREFLHFEQWFSERVKIARDDFVLAILNYINENITRPLQNKLKITNLNQEQINKEYEQVVDKAQLNKIQLSKIFEYFQQNFTTTNQELSEQIMKNFYSLAEIYPNFVYKQVSGQEIEMKANQNFVKIFKGDINVENAVIMLKTYKNSESHQEREVYSMMITSLLDEYRFHDRYPPKELCIIGQLFGSLVKAEILTSDIQKLFLDFIKDSLKNETQKRIDFGIKAIEYMKESILQHQQFCEELFETTQLVQKYFVLLKDIHTLFQNKNVNLKVPRTVIKDINDKYKLYQQNKRTRPEQQLITSAEPEKNQEEEDAKKTISELLQEENKILNNMNISQEVKDKLMSIFNQFTEPKIPSTVTSLKPIVEVQINARWVSRHIIIKRVPQDSNMHKNYVMLANQISKNFFQLLLADTFYLLRKIIDPRYGEKTQDKSIIKTFGHWIGEMTLGINQPILKKHICLNQILTKNFPQNYHIVIPLVCKILEHAKDSIFRKNYWILSLLGTLSEAQEYEDAQDKESKYKIEIKILFKHLLVDPKQLPSTSHFQIKQMMSNDQIRLQQNQLRPVISHLHEWIQIDQRLHQYTVDIELRKLVSDSLDSAIQDTIPPVITRSVTIANITTKSLVFKDFAQEQDPQIIYLAIQYMMQNLSGSLAIVSCRDPLKSSFQEKLNTELKKEKQISEEDRKIICDQTVQDNLDIGCKLIQRTVMSKALQDIQKDEKIIENMKKRVPFQNQDRDFIDEHAMEQVAFLPDCLKPKSHTPLEDKAVYEEFAQECKYLENLNNNQSNQQNQEQTFIEYIRTYWTDIKHFQGKEIYFISQNNSNNFNDAFQYFKNYILQAKLSEEQALNCINSLLRFIFDNFKQEIFLYSFIKILDEIYFTCFKCSKHLVTEKIIKFFQENKKELNCLSTFLKIILQKGYINGQQYYSIIEAIMQQCQQNVLNTVQTFEQIILSQFVNIQQTVIDFEDSRKVFKLFEQYYNQLSQIQQNLGLLQFKQTVKLLSEMLSQDNFKQKLNLNKEYINNFYNLQFFFLVFDQKIHNYSKQLFQEWLNIVVNNNNQQIITFINKFIHMDMISGNNLKKFMVYILDGIVCDIIRISNNYDKNELQSFQNFNYGELNQFTLLMMIILKTITQIDGQILFLNTYSEAILIILTKYYQDQNFNSRPFFKVILNLMNEFVRLEFLKPEVNKYQFLINLLHKLQPSIYPGFAFAWVVLISHKSMFQAFLNDKNTQLQQQYIYLICDLLRYINILQHNDPKFLQNEKKVSYQFYIKANKLLVTLLVDYRDFISEFAFQIVALVDINKILQFKNIILSAYPCDMKNLNKPEVQKEQEMNKKFSYELFKTKANSVFEDFEYEKGQFGLKPLVKELIKLNPDDPNNWNDYQQLFQTILLRVFNFSNKNQSFRLDNKMMTILSLLLPCVAQELAENMQVLNQKIYEELQTNAFRFLMKLIENSHPIIREQILNVIFNMMRYPNQVSQFFCKFAFLIFSKPEKSYQELTLKILSDRTYIHSPQPWCLIYLLLFLCDDKQHEDLRKKHYFKELIQMDDIFKYFKNQQSQQLLQSKEDENNLGPIQKPEVKEAE